eukprot:g4252.t1
MFGGGSRRVFSVFSPARFEEYGDLVHDNLSPESLTAHTPMTVTDRLQPPLSGRGHGGGHGKTSPEERHPESELKPRGNILSGNALSEGEELPEDADPARAPLRADRLRFLSSLANSQSASECSSSSGEVQLEDANADEHEASILEQQWEVEEDAESLVRMQRTLDDTRPSGGDGGGGQRGGSRAIGQETKKVNQHAWDNDNLASTVDAAEDDSSGATYSSSSAMQTGDEADDHEGRTHKDDHEKKLHEHEAAAGVLRSAFSVPYCSSGESTIIGGHATASDIENEVVATPAVARDPFEDAVDDAGAEAEAEADGCSPLTPSSIARGEEQFFPTQCFPVVPTAARPADGPAAPRPKLEHEKQIERASATTPEEQLVQTLTNLPEMLESRIEGVGLGLEKLQGTLSSGLERAKKKVASGSDGLLHTMADGLTKGLLGAILQLIFEVAAVAELQSKPKAQQDDANSHGHRFLAQTDLVQIELASMRLQQQNKDLHELDRLTDKLECQAREIKRELSEQADLMNDLEHQNGGAGDIGAAFAADSRGANFDAERTSTRNFSFASSGNMMIPSLRELQDTMSAQIHRMQRWLEDRSAENEAEEWTCLWMSQMFVARFVVDENNQPHTLRMLCGVFVVSSILLLRAYVL